MRRWIRGENTVVISIRQVVPVDVLVSLTPVYGVAAIVDPNETAIMCQGIELLITLFIHKLTVNQEIIGRLQVLYRNLSRRIAVKGIRLLAKPELCPRIIYILAVIAESEIPAAEFTAAIVAEIPAIIVRIANTYGPVIISNDFKLSWILRT